MPTFLRRIRHSLIVSGSTRKYLLYAAGEVLLVMIGILLALQVNNWNQNRQEAKKQEFFIREINTEFRANKIQLESNVAISHVIPRYIDPITEEMIKEAVEKTEEEVDFAVIDWKGLGKSAERQLVLDALDKLYIPYKRTSQVNKEYDSKLNFVQEVYSNTGSTVALDGIEIYGFIAKIV